MEGKNQEYYTAGQFAEKAGVTIRTIRYYDKMGLIKPDFRGENGYRYYRAKDFAKLQKILTLKYLGIPLENIGQTLEHDISKEELSKSLSEQKDIIEDKIINMKLVIKAIDETKSLLDSNQEFQWDSCVNIIDAINTQIEVMQQYKNSSNLNARISIHDKYSTNKYGWGRWLFDNYKIPTDARILEIGCGNAHMWLKNIDRIPDDCQIILSDRSEGMLNDARRTLGKFSDRFELRILDANNIETIDETFDIVIANHVLFYIEDRQKFFNGVQRILKKDGCFYASTIGNEHMKELKALAKSYDERIEIEKISFSGLFGLESGRSQLEERFENVELRNYDDSLIVKDARSIIDYLYSTHGNLKQIIKNNEADFEKYIEDKIENEKEMYISKYSGLFICSGRK